MHIPVISNSGEMFMKLMVNIARVLILIAEMDSAGSNYPGQRPQCPGGALLLLGPILLSKHDDILEVGQIGPRG